MNHNKTNPVNRDNGVLIRKLFFIGIIISISTGLLTLEGQRLNLYSVEYAIALESILTISVFSIIIGLLSKSINKKTEKNNIALFEKEKNVNQ